MVKTELKDELQNYNKRLSYYIRSSTFPLAIKMVETPDIPDEKIRRPKKQLNLSLTLCQAIGICRKHGWSILLERDDISCPSAILFLGLAEAPESYWQGKFVFAPNNQTEKARAAKSNSLPRFPLKKYSGILISPLFKAAFEPDCVLIYGNAAQMMRFVQASVFKTGEDLKCVQQGGGTCALEVVEPILKGEVGLVLPGNGARIFGLVQDDEMVFSIPYRKMKDIIFYLQESHKGGQRLPIPQYGMFSPELPPEYIRLLETLQMGD